MCFGHVSDTTRLHDMSVRATLDDSNTNVELDDYFKQELTYPNRIKLQIYRLQIYRWNELYIIPSVQLVMVLFSSLKIFTRGVNSKYVNPLHNQISLSEYG